MWVNDGLIALICILICLEVKRELLARILRSEGQVVLPTVAAMAGIIIPVLVYHVFTYENLLAMQSWAIPSVTNIAFALSIFDLFGRDLPVSASLLPLSVGSFSGISAIIITILFCYQNYPQFGYS